MEGALEASAEFTFDEGQRPDPVSHVDVTSTVHKAQATSGEMSHRSLRRNVYDCTGADS